MANLGSTAKPRPPCRFPKLKEEGWILLVSDRVSGELLALKRVSLPIGRMTNTNLDFPVETESGAAIEEATVHLMSDSYLGLDQVATVALAGAQSGTAPARPVAGRLVGNAFEPLQKVVKASLPAVVPLPGVKPVPVPVRK